MESPDTERDQKHFSSQNQTPKNCDNTMPIKTESEQAANPSEPPLKKFFCPCCNIGYTTSEEMINHIKESPVKLKTYTCNVCLLEFFVKADLIDHQRLDHQMAIHKRYKCDQCDLDYISITQLKRHKEMHEEIAQELAASGIFLPQRKKCDTSSDEKNKSSESNTVAQSCARSHSQQTGNEKNLPHKQDNGADRNNFVKEQKAALRKDNTDAKNIIKDTNKICDKEIKIEHSEENTFMYSLPVRSEDPLKDEADEMLVEESDTSDDVEDDDEGEKDPDYTTSRASSYNAASQTRKKCAPKKLSQPGAKQMSKDHLQSDKGDNKLQETAKRKRGRPKLATSAKGPSGSKKGSEVVEIEIPAKLLMEDGSIRCPDCDTTCLNLKGLHRHRKFHFRTKDWLKCVFCDAEFSEAGQMSTHITTEHPLKQYRKVSGPSLTTGQFPCTEKGCTEVFKTSSWLIRHKFKVHGIDKSKANVCEDCGKQCPSWSELMVHRRKHTDERPFKCDLCPKAYRASGGLLLHRKSHLKKKDTVKKGKRPVICEVCGREFPAKVNLKSHMVTHTDERPFKCQFCDATFRHYGTKHAHEKMHKGQTDIICAVCGKIFYRRNALKSHMATHNMKDVPCRLCDKKFSSEYYRTRHEKRCRNYLKCPICLAVFRAHHRLDSHLSLEHPSFTGHSEGSGE